MAISTNYTNIDTFDLLPEGVYETIIVSLRETVTKNGKTGLNLRLVIRNDVEQKYKNRSIFYTLWKRKTPTDADVQVKGYSFQQVMRLAKAASLSDGKSYDSFEDLCKEFLNKCIRVDLKHEEYNGKMSESVGFVYETKFPECKHVFKKAVTEETAAQKPEESFASASSDDSLTSFDDFETVLGDGDVPF